MGSNNRRTPFLGEIFPAREQAYAIQPGHNMLHRSIRPGRPPRSPRQKSALEYWSDGIVKMTQTITPLLQYSTNQTGESLLARDSIREQINVDELVSPDFSHRWHSIADSYYVPAADCLAGFRLLHARRFRGGGEPRDICFASVSLRGFTRIRARVRCEGLRDQYAGHYVAADWRRGATGTHAGGAGAGINHRGGRALGECGDRDRFICRGWISRVAESLECRRRR